MLKFKADALSAVDAYLGDCEQRFSVEYLKRMTLPAEQAWKEIMASTNARYFPRGKNTVLECLQFGGNREFWDGFTDSEVIRRYFAECYRYAVDKIGFLHTHENILCAAIITERVRRNLFVWYLPITETWTSKVMSEEKNERGYQLQHHSSKTPMPNRQSALHAQTATSTTSHRPLTICLIRKLVIPPTDGNCCAHKAKHNIFCEQPKISVPGLDFLEKVRYHRINFPNREHLSRQRPNEQRRLCPQKSI